MKRYLQKLKRHISPLLMIVGSLAGVVYFYIIPLFSNFRECFTEGVNQKIWVGLKNFTDLLSNKAFLLAVRNTVRFYAVSFPLLMIFPLLLALIVVRAGKMTSKKNRISAWFSRLFSRCSVIFTFPIVIPLVSMMMVLDSVFGYEGLLNLCLKSTGLTPLDAYTSSFSFVYLVVVFVIRYSGYNFLIYLAGRVRIQKIYYETAQLDGASDARCFFHITLPLMVPTMFLCLVVTLVNSYKLFREAYMIGGSYPHESIYMIQHFINNNLHLTSLKKEECKTNTFVCEVCKKGFTRTFLHSYSTCTACIIRIIRSVQIITAIMIRWRIVKRGVRKGGNL